MHLREAGAHLDAQLREMTFLPCPDDLPDATDGV